jgi:hypothetical protein
MSTLQKPSFFISPQEARDGSKVSLAKQEQERALLRQLDVEKQKQEHEKHMQRVFDNMGTIFAKIKNAMDNGAYRIKIEDINPTLAEREILTQEKFRFENVDCDYNDSGMARDSYEVLTWN